MAAYVNKDLGQCAAGEVIEVTPAQPGNVFLLDEQNFALYRRGRRVRGVGGPATPGTPMHLTVFEDGRWFVVVDLNGGKGKIRASMRRLDPAEAAAITAEAEAGEAAGAAPLAVGVDQLLGNR
jgi:hypothetical protein